MAVMLNDLLDFQMPADQTTRADLHVLEPVYKPDHWANPQYSHQSGYSSQFDDDWDEELNIAFRLRAPEVGTDVNTLSAGNLLFGYYPGAAPGDYTEDSPVVIAPINTPYTASPLSATPPELSSPGTSELDTSPILPYESIEPEILDIANAAQLYDEYASEYTSPFEEFHEEYLARPELDLRYNSFKSGCDVAPMDIGIPEDISDSSAVDPALAAYESYEMDCDSPGGAPDVPFAPLHYEVIDTKKPIISTRRNAVSQLSSIGRVSKARNDHGEALPVSLPTPAFARSNKQAGSFMFLNFRKRNAWTRSPAGSSAAKRSKATASIARASPTKKRRQR